MIAAFAFDGESDATGLQPPMCGPDDTNPKQVICQATVGGPAGAMWVFEQVATGLRLAEVWSWAEDS